MNKPPLEKILGINALTKVEDEAIPVIKDEGKPAEEQFDSDFDKARANLSHVITKANQALVKTLAIANDKEDARSFEVVDRLLKTLAQTSKDLLEIHGMKKTFKEVKVGPQVTNINNGTVIQQAAFTGTPAELRKHLKAKKEAEMISQPPIIDIDPIT